MFGRRWQAILIFASLMLSIGVATAGATSADVDPRNRDSCNQDTDPDRGIAACTQIIATNPRDAFAFYNRGNNYRVKGDFTRALADYDEAIRLNRRYSAAFDNRGVTHFRLGDLDRAMLDFNTAIEIEPNNPNAHMNRGNLFEAEHEYDRAIADYNLALKVRPYALCNYNRAVADHPLRTAPWPASRCSTPLSRREAAETPSKAKGGLKRVTARRTTDRGTAAYGLSRREAGTSSQWSDDDEAFMI